MHLCAHPPTWTSLPSCCTRPLRREDLASLNRSIQATAKGIKVQLEALSRDKGTLPEQQQAKLRKLTQDFVAALQVRRGKRVRGQTG